MAAEGYGPFTQALDVQKGENTLNVTLEDGTVRILLKENAEVREPITKAKVSDPWHPDRVRVLFQEAVEQTKAPRIRMHDMRHTWATLALRAGVHPKIVQERLGHANIRITLDTYSHVLPDMQETAAELVAALVAAADAESKGRST